METFAFLYHPTTLSQVKHFWPVTNFLPPSFISSYLKKSALKIINLRDVRSANGTDTHGYIMVMPILPDELFETDSETILTKVIAASQMARGLGVKILGLSGYLAAVADKKPMIYKHIKIAVTSGNSLTAWAAFESVFRKCQEAKMDLNKSTITILGTNGIGILCAAKFAALGSKVILSAGTSQKLDTFKSTILKSHKAQVEVETDTRKAVQMADIVINTYNGPGQFIQEQDFKPGTILCDASVFKQLLEKIRHRSDLTVINSGTVKTPLGQKFGQHIGFPAETISTYMAEVLLLALEESFVNYSLGENINIDKMEAIADLAAKHGFEIL